MQTRKERCQEDLFVAAPLRALVPEDHVLRRVDAVLDLSWLHEAVRDCYCQDNGRPSIDPESALRLMLAGFFYNLVGDRPLMREAQVNLAIRWFAGYRLDEALPDRSSLTHIRQRWGESLFRAVFERTVAQCAAAGLVNAETVHIDATLIRADVSWDSLTTRYVDAVLEATGEELSPAPTDGPPADGDGPGAPPKPGARGRIKKKKYSPTDPEATMATSCRQHHLEPTYKQHTAVEDQSGVIVDVAVTTGESNEGKELPGQLERIEKNTGDRVRVLTADGAYAHGTNYATLEDHGTDAVIPPPRIPRRRKGTQRIPARRFKYDAEKDRVTCPAGRFLHRKGRTANGNGSYFRASARDCKTCPLRARCLSAKAHARSLVIVDGYPSLLRARRRKEKGWDPTTRDHYCRHRWHVEGVHGRAKTQHGLRRAARRGLANLAMQCYLTAAVMNLKKLAGKTPRTLEKAGYAIRAALRALVTRTSHYATTTGFRFRRIRTPTAYASTAT